MDSDDLIRPSRRRLSINEWTGTGKTVGIKALLASRPALYVKIFLAMLLLGQGALIYQFIVERAWYAHWIAGAAFAAIFLMLVALSMSAARWKTLMRIGAWVRLACAYAVVALVVAVGIAAVAALAAADIAVLYLPLAWLAPNWPIAMMTLAVLGGLVLLRLEYVAGVSLLDHGRKSFSLIRQITVIGLAIAIAAAAGWSVMHGDRPGRASRPSLPSIGRC